MVQLFVLFILIYCIDDLLLLPIYIIMQFEIILFVLNLFESLKGSPKKQGRGGRNLKRGMDICIQYPYHFLLTSF